MNNTQSQSLNTQKLHQPQFNEEYLHLFRIFSKYEKLYLAMKEIKIRNID